MKKTRDAKRVAIIEARMKSNRLPGKMLWPTIGKPMHLFSNFVSNFYNLSCQKTHKLACGMNGILLEQGLLGDGESPNNCLPSSPTEGMTPLGGLDAWCCNRLRMLGMI